MATQVSYPGVYIEEFTPAAPIEGVSTSIAAFIGIAERGPIGMPQLVTSLEGFTERFGGSLGGATPYYLPLAVQGFFENGGRTAYIVRVGTGGPAFADLPSQEAAPQRLAKVKAKADGSTGNGGKAKVDLADVATLGVVTDTQDIDTTVPSPGVNGVSVQDPSKFQAGDQVVLIRGVSTLSNRLRVASVDPAGTGTPGIIWLESPIPSHPNNSAWARIKLADPAAGDTLLRVDPSPVPSLRAAATTGSIVKVADGTATEWHIAAEVGADSIRLATPLKAASLDRAATTVTIADFDLTITDAEGVARLYADLSTSPLHPRWWGSAVDDLYATVALENDVVVTGDPRPASGTVAVQGATDDNPATSWANVLLETELKKYLATLEPIDEISLVAVPGCTDAMAQRAVVEHCEKMFDRFAILDSLKDVDLPTVSTQREGLAGTLNRGFAALYYPWITITDPARRRVVPHPPSGHVAGIFAKTDQSRGVHKAPANVAIAGAVGLERRLTDSEQGLINLKGVNALRILPGRGQPVVWGARTTATDTNWQYINIRRLFLFLEESIQESLGLSVFEPNDLGLWQRLKRTITEFLTRVWRDGALFGATAKDAFYVRIDEVLNPPSTRKLGRLFIEIGVQPVYPAEFIVVRIGIWDGGAEVAEV